MAATTKPGESAAAVIVWDFDWSLVNDNSDTLAIQKLEGKAGPAWERGRAAQAAGEIAPGWTSLMDSCVSSLWDAGFRRDDFADALESIPILNGAAEVSNHVANYAVMCVECTVLACVHAMCVRTPYTIELGIASVVCLHAGQRLPTFLQREEAKRGTCFATFFRSGCVLPSMIALMRRQSCN
jgi:hypothetical protein